MDGEALGEHRAARVGALIESIEDNDDLRYTSWRRRRLTCERVVIQQLCVQRIRASGVAESMTQSPRPRQRPSTDRTLGPAADRLRGRADFDLTHDCPPGVDDTEARRERMMISAAANGNYLCADLAARFVDQPPCDQPVVLVRTDLGRGGKVLGEAAMVQPQARSSGEDQA